MCAIADQRCLCEGLHMVCVCRRHGWGMKYCSILLDPIGTVYCVHTYIQSTPDIRNHEIHKDLFFVSRSSL